VFKLGSFFFSVLSTASKIRFLVLLVLSLTSALAEMATLGSLFPILGAIISNKIDYEIVFLPDNLDLSDLAFLFMISFVVASILKIVVMWYQARLSYGLGAEINSIIYRRALGSDYQYIIDHDTSEIVAALVVKGNQLIRQLIYPVQTLFSSSIIIISILLILFSLTPNVSIAVGLIAAGFYVFVYWIVRFRLEKFGEIVSTHTLAQTELIIESFGNIKEVISSRLGGTYTSKYESIEKVLKTAQAEVLILGLFPKYLLESIIIIGCSGWLWIIIDNNPSQIYEYLPVVGLYVVAAQRLLPSVQILFSSLASIKSGGPAIRSLISIYESSIDRAFEEANSDDCRSISASFSCKNLRFKFGDRLILKDVSFEMKIGSIYGLVGPSGHGKTSLVSIISGLLQYDSGQFFIDGEVFNGSLIRFVSLVPQEIFILNGNLEKNISLDVDGKLNVNVGHVRECSSLAEISDLPSLEGKDAQNSMFGENGKRLSGGQRQRVGIARALFKNRPILILDESTAGLNTTLERKVLKNLQRAYRNGIIIIVSHRTTSLEFCDEIYELKDGSLTKHNFDG